MPKKKDVKDLLTPEEYERFQKGFIPLQKWDKIMEPLIEEARESARITAEDLKFIINC
ncbi:MAG: hypothetical protein AAB652_02195 [Patescibacteria group bacterium]